MSWPVRLTELPDKGAKLPPGEAATLLIMLDEKGEQLGSLAFARELERWRDGGVREARFLIGGADGFAADAGARQSGPAPR